MYFENLSNMVESGQLNLLFVIAPPRTSSTFLETALADSPSVSTNCHEPFIHVGYSELDPEEGYKCILDTIKNQQAKTEGEVRTVVIKDMASWLLPHEEYKKLFTLTKKPVAFLIRNPLLTAESRIEKVVHAISLAPRLSTQQAVLDCAAKDRGYPDWPLMNKDQSTLAKKGISTETGLAEADLQHAYIEPEKVIQEQLLAYYASRMGFSSWEAFINNAFSLKDYTSLGEVLNFDRHRFSTETSGWNAMQKLVGYLEGQKAPFSVIDSTELRLDPETVLKKVCGDFEITFCEEMINWQERVRVFGNGQERPQDKLWYKTLMESRGVKPPSEVIPRLADFPHEVRSGLSTVDMPIYVKTFRNRHRICGRTDIDTLRFPVTISESLRGKYLAAGIIDELGQQEVMASIREIDPVFSVLYNPALANDSEYLDRNRYYFNEVAQVARLLEAEKERTMEGDFPGRRK